ncbi:chitin synthase 1 [Chlorella sorokiniana]|uniref:chitin synthase n=1 Tax=Chlorella sorokiniana TaxID=3076 RepID=A0A2P6U521_CHLSO|nr:chitin synthase 1 [Chlorella sorokiniana]|eukprot:PRW61415.1 chitin synthase 1 [Chlorella sorokiniana]
MGPAEGAPPSVDYVEPMKDVEMEEIFVINDDITVEKPIDDYYAELDKRLQGLKSQLGSDADWMPSTYEKYMTGQHQVAGSLQRNVREYYNDFKLLRADTQVYYPVPNEVYRDEWDDVQVTDPMEFTHCRYTPVVTEDARDFGVDGYTLRLQRMDRKIKLFICVTLYNEDYDELRKTLVGICDNLEVMYDQFVAKDGRRGMDWTEVAVCIVQDGIGNANESVLAASTVHGFFSPVVLQTSVLGAPTTLHLFEYTARFKKYAGLDNYPPLQIMFATKGKNKGKLDSHCWYFDAFCYLLQPEFCVLFDAGTKPLPSALKSVATHFQRYPSVGALTGELTVQRPYRTFLTAVQFCEWKVSHLLQKPIESVCGFLTVLPGAFCAFRWAAVEGEPLRRYFYGLYSQAELNAFEANMFLAEDRILCIEVVAKKGCNYRLEYIKEAVAEADAVTKLTGLMKQRRRWLNGTFFAMLYALGNMGRIWTESAHSVGRKVTLTLEFMYLTINLIFGTWFGIGIFYVLLYMLLKVAFDSEGWLVQIGNVVQLLYLFLIIVQLIINLKNKPEAVEKIHSFCAIYFCLYMLVFTGVSISFLITNTDYSFMGISTQKLALVVAILMSALGGILLTALLHGEILAVLGAGFQYWIMQPVFFNMLQMYAFCNADDISWGTKNLDTKHADHDAKKMASKALAYQVRPSKTSKAFWDAMSKVQNHLTDAKKIAAYNQKKEQKMRAFSSYLLIAWVSTNVIFVAAATILSNSTWESCAMTESEMAVNAVKSQAVEGDKALIMADLIQTAVTILQRGEALYPFHGLQGFPDNYPMLITGDAQSNAVRGSPVTVLANATELFSNLDASMPKFSDWLQQGMGINSSATLEEYGRLWMPMPSNTTNGYDSHVVCTMHYGYTYFLQIMFIILCVIVLFQVGGSVIFIVAYWVRRWTGRDRKDGSGGALQRAPSGSTHGGMAMGAAAGMPMMGSVKSFYSSDPTGSEVEIAIQPGSARYAGGQMVMPPAGDEPLTDDSYSPRSDNSPSPVRRRRGDSPHFQ